MVTHSSPPADPTPPSAGDAKRPTTLTDRLRAKGHKVYDHSTMGQAFQEGFEEAKAAREAREAKAKADNQAAKEGPQK